MTLELEHLNIAQCYLFLSVKDLAFLVFGPAQPLPLEVGVSQVLGKFHGGQINLCRCRNDKFLVNPSQWDTV